MKLYIKNLVNRLSEFSEKLDNITLFVEKKWVLIDDEGNKQTFIFERNGDLVMSLNGQVKMGKWKYYPAARSILIDRIEDKILLNQAFFDKAVMILKYDGLPDRDLFTLADENLIQDLDIKKYLQTLFNKRFNVITGILENGSTIEIHRKDEVKTQIGMEVTIDNDIPEDGRYRSSTSNIIYELKRGKIYNMNFFYKYLCNGIEIEIEQRSYNEISTGDHVYIDDMLAPSGKYKMGFMDYIIVKEGVIVGHHIW